MGDNKGPQVDGFVLGESSKWKKSTKPVREDVIPVTEQGSVTIVAKNSRREKKYTDREAYFREENALRQAAEAAFWDDRNVQQKKTDRQKAISKSRDRARDGDYDESPFRSYREIKRQENLKPTSSGARKRLERAAEERAKKLEEERQQRLLERAAEIQERKIGRTLQRKELEEKIEASRNAKEAKWIRRHLRKENKKKENEVHATSESLEEKWVDVATAFSSFNGSFTHILYEIDVQAHRLRCSNEVCTLNGANHDWWTAVLGAAIHLKCRAFVAHNWIISKVGRVQMVTFNDDDHVYNRLTALLRSSDRESLGFGLIDELTGYTRIITTEEEIAIREFSDLSSYTMRERFDSTYRWLIEKHSDLMFLVRQLESKSSLINIAGIVQDFLCFSYLVFTHRDRMSLYAITYGWTYHYSGKSPIVANLVSAVCSLFSRQPAIATSESLSDDIEEGFSWLIQNLDCQCATALRNLFLVIVSLHVFPKDIASTIYRELGHLENTSLFGILKVSIESFISILRVAEFVQAGVPVSEALLTGDPVKNLINQAKELVRYKDRTYNGLPIAGFRELRMYAVDVENCKKALDVLKRKAAVYKKHKKALDPLIDEIDDIHTRCVSRMSNTNRIPPVGVIISGPPGIGKSTLINAVAAVFCKSRDLEFSTQYIYHRVMSSEYWEGHDPRSQRIYHYSEVGSKKKQLVEKQGDDILAEITSIMDSQPYMLNYAAVELKGKFFAQPELVIIDTNVPDLGISHIVENPAAYLRRFLHLEVQVKPGMTHAGANSLNPSSVGDDWLNVWNFNLSEAIAIDNKNINRVDLLQGYANKDIDAVSDALLAVFKKKFAQNASVVDKMNDPKSFAHLGHEAKSESFEDVRTYALYLSTFPYKAYFSDKARDVYRGVRHSFEYTWRCGTDFGSLSCSILEYIAWNAMTSFSFDRPTEFALTWWTVFVCFLCFFVSHFFLPLLIIAPLNPRWVLWNLKRGFQSKRKIEIMSDVAQKWDKFKNSVYDVSNDFSNGYSGYIAVLTTTLVVVSILSRYFDKPKRRDIVVGTSNPSVVRVVEERGKPWEAPILRVVEEKVENSNSQSRISEIESMADCGGVVYKIPVKDSASWNSFVPLVNIKQGPFTGEPIDLVKTVRGNVKLVRLRRNQSGIVYEMRTHIFFVRGNFALINTHAVSNYIGGTLDISPNGTFDDNFCKMIHINPDCVYDIGNDISVIRVSSHTGKDIIKHILDSDFPSICKGAIGDETSTCIKRELSLPVDAGKYTLERSIQYRYSKHTTGFCGHPLVLQLPQSCVIAGIHSACDRDNYCYSSPLSRTAIVGAIAKMSAGIFSAMSEANVMLQTELPIAKSLVNYEYLPGITYHGKLLGPVIMPGDSRVTSTGLDDSKELTSLFAEVMHFSPSKTFGPPLMRPATFGGKYVSPFNVNLRKIADVKKPLREATLSRVVEFLSQHIVTGLKDMGVQCLKPLTLMEAVNGMDDDPLMRRINASTAAGFGFPGKKDKYIPIYDGTTRKPVPDLVGKVVGICDSYSRGENAGIVYSCSLKDEPRDQDKVPLGKTRMFYVSPLDHLIVQRMFLAPFYNLMMKYSYVFCTSIGRDMHRHSDTFRRRLESFSNSILEGDYEGWDTKLPFDISRASGAIICNVLKSLGYNDYAISMVRGIVSDNLYCYITLLNDLWCAPGIQPSGKYGTAEDNSIKGLVMLVYFFTEVFGSPDGFFHYVLPDIYGDDVVAAVKPEITRFFNNLSYRDFVKEVYGMGFTPAAKAGEMQPFVTPSTMQFLKRSYVKHPVMDRYVGQLDKESLMKTLKWYIPSDSVSREEQLLNSSSSVLLELFFHCDENQYVQMRKGIRSLLCENGVPLDMTSAFPTYRELLDRFSATSESWELTDGEFIGDTREPRDDVHSESDVYDHKEYDYEYDAEEDAYWYERESEGYVDEEGIPERDWWCLCNDCVRFSTWSDIYEDGEDDDMPDIDCHGCEVVALVIMESGDSSHDHLAQNRL